MPDLLQHVIVTLIAISAAWIIVRRVFSAVLPSSGSHDCASCPVARNVPNRPRSEQVSPGGPAGSATYPLTLVKRTRS